MSTDSHYVPLEKTKRSPLRDARVIGPTDPNQRLEVTLRLRRKSPLPPLEEMSKQLPGQRRYMTPEEIGDRHGADTDDLDRVAAFAQSHGLHVVESSAARRSVILSGTVGQMSRAFQVTLEDYEYPHGTYRGRTGPVSVPSDLANVVEAVFGLDNRPFAKPHFTRSRQAGSSGGGEQSFTPPALAQLYNFPAGLTGSGQTIGIIELGGGYRTVDLDKYFQTQVELKKPSVRSVSVDHAHNSPVGDPDSADGEVVLDIEVAGSVAPGAKIVVYFAPNLTDQNFLDALTTAIHDTKHKPSIISISWGGPESAATEAFMEQFDSALQSAAALGITVLTAAGDNGAADSTSDQWDGVARADFPSASPWILSCGGTSVRTSGGAIAIETVWNQHGVDPAPSFSFGATGGGISQFFPVPSYQSGLEMPAPANPGDKAGRGVPDVAGDADPATGYDILVDGQLFSGRQAFGGTSAVAPLWAGLIACINEGLGTRAGFINALLYSKGPSAGAVNDIVTGDNKVSNDHIGYSAGPGWDACTGLGSPNGAKLLTLLKGP